MGSRVAEQEGETGNGVTGTLRRILEEGGVYMMPCSLFSLSAVMPLYAFLIYRLSAIIVFPILSTTSCIKGTFTPSV